MTKRSLKQILTKAEMRKIMERGTTGVKRNRIWVDLSSADAVKHGVCRIEWQL